MATNHFNHLVQQAETRLAEALGTLQQMRADRDFCASLSTAYSNSSAPDKVRLDEIKTRYQFARNDPAWMKSDLRRLIAQQEKVVNERQAELADKRAQRDEADDAIEKLVADGLDPDAAASQVAAEARFRANAKLVAKWALIAAAVFLLFLLARKLYRRIA